jgi:hypothetical protein
MEKELTELENLKQRLSKKQNPNDEVWMLRAVMREVGGYEQLMKLPMPAYNVIAESIIQEKEAEKADYDKAKAHSRLKK